MTKKRSNDFKAAVRRKQLVCFTRPFEEGSVSGYVLGVSSYWLLLSLVSGDIRFNGFQCFRLCDVRRFQMPHPHAEFFEAALKKREERVPKRPRVNLACIEDLLRSANRSFPLVTIFRERVDPDFCWVGRVLEMDTRRVTLLQINPDARWHSKPTDFRLSEITRVDFGGDYEDALHIVGGSPPG
jgi:hypothetical protein